MLVRREGEYLQPYNAHPLEYILGKGGQAVVRHPPLTSAVQRAPASTDISREKKRLRLVVR